MSLRSRTPFGLSLLTNTKKFTSLGFFLCKRPSARNSIKKNSLSQDQLRKRRERKWHPTRLSLSAQLHWPFNKNKKGKKKWKRNGVGDRSTDVFHRNIKLHFCRSYDGIFIFLKMGSTDIISTKFFVT